MLYISFHFGGEKLGWFRKRKTSDILRKYDEGMECFYI